MKIFFIFLMAPMIANASDLRKIVETKQNSNSTVCGFSTGIRIGQDINPSYILILSPRSFYIKFWAIDIREQTDFREVQANVWVPTSQTDHLKNIFFGRTNVYLHEVLTGQPDFSFYHAGPVAFEIREFYSTSRTPDLAKDQQIGIMNLYKPSCNKL